MSANYPPTRPMALSLSLLPLLATLAGCAANTAGAGPPTTPWIAEPLDPSSVPSAFLEQWSAAENRATCDLIAPRSTDPADAAPRAATFAGGWGVAYDLPDLRSAFGVAGTGASATGVTYDQWPFEIVWADGSVAGYGPEGGTGPNQLAYLTIPGQRCLYNVWSRLGVEHLEALLGSLRYVATPDA